MNFIRDLSVKYKIFCAIALLIAGIGVFMISYFPKNLTDLSFRGLVNESKTLSLMMSFSVAGGVEFDDTQTAKDVFKNAGSNKNFRYATIIKSEDGSEFASIGNESSQHLKGKSFADVKTESTYFETPGLLNVVTPVVSGKDVIAHLITGFSTDDIETARKENLTTIAGITAIIFMIGLFFAFYTGTSITRPIQNVIDAAVKVSSGDLNQSTIPVASRDETGKLADQFNTMVAAIRKSDSNLRSLLGGLSEGIFFFDRNGVIAKERSQALQNILPGSDRFERLEDFMAQYAQVKPETCQAVLKYLWDREFMSPFDGTVAMMATKFFYQSENGIRDIRVQYRELNDEAGQLDKVIVFISDITEQLEAERKQRAQEERVKRISMAASDQESFGAFRDDIISLLQRVDAAMKKSTSVDFAVLKRDLHTIKGNIATYEFKSLAERIHEIEDCLTNAAGGDIPDSAREKWELVKDQWKFESSDIQEVLGLQKHENYARISREKVNRLRSIKLTDNPALERQIRELDYYPAAEVFGKYCRLTESVAQRVDKMAQLEFAPDCSDLPYSMAKRLDGALVHIIRNCVDHGIERVDARENVGKPRSGRIHFGCFRKENRMNIFIKDDGAGINGTKLADKAVLNGVWTKEKARSATYQEKIQLIFAPGLSTAEQVTDVSGRGVGMDAAKALVEELGGKLTVFSQEAVGTQFEIAFDNLQRLDEPASPTRKAA